MKTFFRFGFLICLIIAFCASAYSWNRRGHLMVAAVAFQALEKSSPDTLAKINLILKSHPAASRWRAEYKAALPDIASQMAIEAYFFIRAAAWPDDVRVPLQNPETRPLWHFVNYPLRLPDSIDFDTIVPAEGIFFGMNKVTPNSGVPAPSKPKQAKNLSWVFHLVGDIHQPLHTVALFDARFTRGDSGGNGMCIRPRVSVASSNLHTYWDGLMGTKQAVAFDALQAYMDAAYYAKTVTDVRQAQFGGPPDIPAVSKESARLSLSNVYQFNGETVIGYKKIKVVKNGQSKSSCPKIKKADILAADYIDAAETLAKRQVLKSGYRLTSALQTAFAN